MSEMGEKLGNATMGSKRNTGAAGIRSRRTVVGGLWLAAGLSQAAGLGPTASSSTQAPSAAQCPGNPNELDKTHSNPGCRRFKGACAWPLACRSARSACCAACVIGE